LKDLHQTFIEQAVELAVANVKSGNGGPFGALVVRNGEIVGRGANSVTTSNDPTAHAEVNAIRDACKNLNTYQLDDCVVYTSCEPCPMCLGAIYWARPKAIYYAADQNDAANAGFDDSFIYKEIELQSEKRSIPAVHLQTGNNNEPFEVWNAFESRKEY